MQARKQEQGFTMIELMITVAVIGILVAVGLPSYSNAVRKSNRSEAQSALMNIATRQQQMLVDTRKYVATVEELKVLVPDKVSSHYSVTITLGTGTVPSFLATATPLGSQTKDSCGTLTVDQNNTKLPANCW